MTVLLLRHGRSTSNTAHTLAGRSPGVDLDDRGREQAEALVERIGRTVRLTEAGKCPLHRVDLNEGDFKWVTLPRPGGYRHITLE